MEYLEIWNWDTGEPTGEIVERSESHRSGIPHEGVHLWIYRMKGKHAELILQRRAINKDLYPGYLDISVGGHVPFGHDEGKIQKEAREELGIEINDADLSFLGRYRYEEKVPEINLFHREFQSVYIARIDEPLSFYKFNDGEVDGVCSIRLKLFADIIRGDRKSHKVEFFDGDKIYQKDVDYTVFHPLFFTNPMKIYLEVVLGAVQDALKGKAALRKFKDI